MGTPTRVNRLGEGYAKTALQEKIAGARGRSAGGKTVSAHTGRKVNLLIDIQAKLVAGKGAGYERWAKIFNLKEAAKTLNFLMENGLADYDELVLKAAQAEDGFNEVSQKIKQLEARMAGVAQLSKEYAALLEEKQAQYEQYKALRHDMIAYQTALRNVDKSLGLEPLVQEPQRQPEQKKQDTQTR